MFENLLLWGATRAMILFEVFKLFSIAHLYILLELKYTFIYPINQRFLIDFLKNILITVIKKINYNLEMKSGPKATLLVWVIRYSYPRGYAAKA